MPRIAAPTVAEHRANIQRKLVDAAESILRSGEPEQLTAAAVTAAAGIARNSIYRYVASVDDLRGLVLERHLPAWLTAVEEELSLVEEPEDRIAKWVEANLRQAARSGHGWLMGLGRSAAPSPATARVMAQAHNVMRDVLAQAWSSLMPDPQRARVAGALTRGLLEAGFRQLDDGVGEDVVVDVAVRATRGLVAGAR